jgi:hypothetical protein
MEARMAEIIRLLDYEPVARPEGFKPSKPADILFFTGVRYEKAPKKKKSRKSAKSNNQARKVKRSGA